MRPSSTTPSTADIQGSDVRSLVPGLNALGLPACVILPDETIIFANRAYCDLSGLPEGRVVGQKVAAVVTEENYEIVRPHLLHAFRTGDRVQFHRKWITPQGVWHWVMVNYFPQQKAEGVVEAIVATITDAQQMKDLESRSNEHERLLRKLTDSAGLPIMYLDVNLTLLFANQPFFDWMGRTEQELINRHILDAFDPKAAEFYLGHATRALAGETFKITTLSKARVDGARHIEINFYPDKDSAGNTVGLFVLAFDIEADYQLRQNLIAKEIELRSVADSIGLPVSKSNRELRYEYVNSVACEWFGLDEASIVGRHWSDVIGAAQFAHVEPYVRRALEGEPVSYERLAHFRGRPAGHIRVNMFPNRNPAGEVVGVYVVIADIEKDYQLRQELQNRERQVRLITDNIGLPLSYISADRTVQFFNKTGSEWTGKSEERILGKSIEEVFGQEIVDWVQPYLDRAMAGTPQTYERLATWANRGQRWTRGHVLPDRRPDGSIAGVYTVLMDIHEDVVLRENLQQQERQLRLFTDNVPEAIVYLDLDRRYKFVNNTFLQQRGKARHEVIGKTSAEVLGEEAAQLATPFVERAFRGETVTYERLAIMGDGTRRWMRNRTVPDFAADGTVQGLYVAGVDIHDIKVAQEVLRTSEAELRQAMDSLPYPMAYIDKNLHYCFINKALEQAIGRPRSEIIGSDLRSVFSPERYEESKPLWARALAGETVNVERLTTTSSGEQRWMIMRYTPRLDDGGNVIGFYSAATDVDGLKRTELELRRANWLLSSHFENTPLAVIEWDPDFRVRRWSPQAEKMFGWSERDVRAKPFTDWKFVVEDDLAQVASVTQKLITKAEQRTTSLNRNYRKDGRVIWCEWYNSTLSDESGQIISVLSLVQDVTTRVLAEERLVHQATHDSLTGLPNRTMLQDRLRQAIVRARRSGCRVAALFVDLDRFKDVNDTLGHRVGDELLREMSLRLGRVVRESDLLVRLSGDEFMVVLEQVNDLDSPRTVAAKLLDEISHPSYIEGHEIHVSASIGISLFPDDAEDVEALLKNADMAMYRAKEMGKNAFEVFSPDLAEHGSAMRLLENSLRSAIARNEFELYYQPKIEMSTGRIVGAEALLRWHHPHRGMVPPGEFIHLAEETGLVHDIGNWVLEKAFLQIRDWHAKGHSHLRLAINLAAGQFRATHLADRIREKMQRIGCDAHAIEVEVTETGMLRDPEGVGHTLSALREFGVSVAIDDFGTGYSSLSHLKRFPIDTLKIDKSFVAEVLIDKGDAAIVSAVIAMAQALEIEVVAEGVETPAQRQMLADLGCQAWQGYLFSEALPAPAFEDLLNKSLTKTPVA
jgi:diguanylate cyclase (GGDEF)-like protein/PAS domain S-box-containing protein